MKMKVPRDRRAGGMIPILIGSLLFLILAVPSILPQTSSADGPILFEENFSKKQNSDGTPGGWGLKQWSGSSAEIRLVPEDGRRVLHLLSVDNSFGVYREFKFDVREYPILRWRWKVTALPQNGDVRRKETDDQAAQIYVPFPRFPAWLNTRLVGYIWENKTPKGLKVTSRKFSSTRYIVLESGAEKLGQWVEEERNVYEDYKTLFGEEPPLAGGITLMIDSDDTHSRAEGFFADIRIEKAKPAEAKP